MLSARGIGVIIPLYYSSYLLCGDTVFLCDGFGFYTGVVGGDDFGLCVLAELIHPRGDFYHIVLDNSTGNEIKLKQIVGIDNHPFYDSPPYSDFVFAVDVVLFYSGYNILSADCVDSVTGAVYSGDAIADNTGVFL